MLATYNIDPNHRAKIKRLAEARGMNASEWLRHTVDEAYEVWFPPNAFQPSQADSDQLSSVSGNPWINR
jgi:hypothetical protein